MPRLLRDFQLLVLTLTPIGCEWCRAPASWKIDAEATVRDSAGAVLGEARVSLFGYRSMRASHTGWLSVEMLGPPSLATTPPGFPSGGPLQGWVHAVRLERASGVQVLRLRPGRGSGRAVFQQVNVQLDAPDDADRFLALRRDPLDGHLALEIDVLPDPLAPRIGPLRVMLRRGDVSRREGGCT